MIQPRKAAVKPRVILPDGTELPLEDEIRRFVDRGATGFVMITGQAGAGKTTALEHLAAVLPSDQNVILRELAIADDFSGCALPDRLIIIATRSKPGQAQLLAEYELAPWNRDDFIEYLLARHRQRCASVMKRIGPQDSSHFDGNPELWTILLDQLAADESLPDANSGLRRYLELQLPDTDIVQRSRNACLNLLTAENSESQMAKLFSPPGFPPTLTRILRNARVQLVLASERVLADLRGDESCDFLGCRLSRELVHCVARQLTPNDKGIARLRDFVTGPAWGQAMAASLLHAAKVDWKPSVKVVNLAGAYLEGVDWAGVELTSVNRRKLVDLSNTDLRAANLNGAKLDGVMARRACFRRAQLRDASMEMIEAEDANFQGAILSSARGLRAEFTGADLSHAVADSSSFLHAHFTGANLTSASFAFSTLRGAIFTDANLDLVDFSSADLEAALLPQLQLSTCSFRGAQLSRANLTQSNLEGVNFEDAILANAKLTDALLTGTTIRNGDLRNANLQGAGLGEINWENCDLRDADFTGASFHMGSSRSGLLFTTIASEGTRTGFYTDDYEERSFKEPEEIRKANLCGCDLRGARVAQTDFYLVDLRGAIYDDSQKSHFKRCGAILGPL